MKTATVTGPAILEGAKSDLAAVGRIVDLTLVEADEVTVRDIVLDESAE